MLNHNCRFHDGETDPDPRIRLQLVRGRIAERLEAAIARVDASSLRQSRRLSGKLAWVLVVAFLDRWVSRGVDQE
jgi:hypothetical protein